MVLPQLKEPIGTICEKEFLPCSGYVPCVRTWAVKGHIKTNSFIPPFARIHRFLEKNT